MIQKGNGKLLPDGLKMLNSNEMIQPWSGWYGVYVRCWCGSSPEFGVTVLYQLNHTTLCSSSNYPVLILPSLQNKGDIV